jgi:hypothetical protein
MNKLLKLNDDDNEVELIFLDDKIKIEIENQIQLQQQMFDEQ